MSDVTSDAINESLEEAWAAHVHEATRRLLVMSGCFVGVGMILALLFDVLFLTNGPALRVGWRGLPGQAAICLLAAAMLEWVPVARTHLYSVVIVAFIFLVGAAGSSLSLLGGMDGPFFYIAYLLPCAVLGLPLSLPYRCALTAIVLGTFLLAFFGPHPGHFDHAYAHIAWVHLTIITIAFIYFGDLLQKASRERFFFAALAGHQAELLTRDNGLLAGEVAEQTRAVLSVTDRAAHVRWEERVQLARALHDDVGQHLVSARAHLQDVGRALNSMSDDDVVANLRRVLENIERSTRDIVTGFREDAIPFEVDVEDLVETFRSLDRMEIEVDLRCQEWEPRPRVRDVCKRVIQESLTNVFKHASATHVHVAVARKGNDVSIRVTDNGRGLPDDSEDGRGFGLRGMRERVEELDGTFAVSRGRKEGTRVTVTLPVLADCHDAGEQL
jgi:signal transduction histidine kinase